MRKEVGSFASAIRGAIFVIVVVGHCTAGGCGKSAEEIQQEIAQQKLEEQRNYQKSLLEREERARKEQEEREESRRKREEEKEKKRQSALVHKPIWLECEEELKRTYYRSGTYSRDADDLNFIYHQIQRADDIEEKQMQRRLYTALLYKIRRDKYPYVKDILNKYNMRRIENWIVLEENAREYDW